MTTPIMTPKKESSTEYDRFDEAMERLLKVPHSKIKEELEAEKAVKKQKPKKEPRAKR